MKKVNGSMMSAVCLWPIVVVRMPMLLLFLWVFSFGTMASVPINGDTVTISSVYDGVTYFMTAGSGAKLYAKTAPCDSSLWITIVNLDTVVLKNMVTGKYFGERQSGSDFLLTDTVINWTYQESGSTVYFYNVPQKTYLYLRVFKNGTSIYGVASGGFKSSFNLTTYTEINSVAHFNASPSEMQFENDSAKQLLELSSHKSYTYDPVDDTSAPIISGISSYEYSVTPSDGSWMKMVKDTLKVSSMTSLGQRRGSVLMSIPSQGYSTELTVIQSNGLDRLNFAHTEGMSGRTLTSAGLQSVSERVETYYCLSTDTAWLILPQSNGSKPPQAYYRWFNYGDDETVTDGLLLATGYYKFLDDRGYFSLKYLSDTSRFVVSLNTLPFQVACDVSDYDDYSYTTSSTDSTLNEPTLSYRVVYNLLPASEMATRFTSAQAVGSTATYYLENYNVIAPIGAVVRISTAYDVQGSMCSYFGYDGSNVLERVDSLELYQGGVLVTDYSIDRNRTLVLPAATATGLVVYQLRGLLADGTVLNIAEFRVRYEDASILGPVTSSSGLVSATNLVTNYSYLSGSWYYDFSRNTPFDNWSATELGFAYNSASKMRYPYQSGVRSAAAAGGEYQFLTQTGSSQPSDVVQNVKGVAFSPAIDFGGAQLSQGFCYVDPGGNASTVSMCSFTPINNEVSTTYFGTVWVNNLYQESGNYPHLSFIVEEEINSVYTPVVEYASGDITSTVGSWAQIGFHFQLSTPVSESYRVRLVANGSSTQVHRFGIDQFGLYAQLPAMSASGVVSDCDALTDTSKYVAVRLDYSGTTLFANGATDTTLYYQCTDSLGNIIRLTNNGVVTGGSYGSVSIDNVPTATTTLPIYINSTNSSAISQYFTALESNSALGNGFYAKDTAGGVDNYLFYIVLESGQWNACESYVVRVYTESNFTDTYLLDTARFVPLGECLYLLDGDVQSNTASGICPSKGSTFTLRQQYMLNSASPVWVSGYYDWLLGAPADYGSGGIYGSYSYNSIVAALKALHADTTYMKSKSVPTTGNSFITTAQLALIDSLLNDSVLWLYRDSVTVAVMDSSVNFVVYPYGSTLTVSGSATPMSECEVPLQVSAVMKSGAPWLILGNHDEEISSYGLSYVRTSRHSVKQLDAGTFTLPVVSTNLTPDANKSIGTFSLISSTDTSFDSYENDVVFSSVMLIDSLGDKYLSVSGKSSSVPSFTYGNSYTLLLTIEDEAACDGYQKVILYVQPNYLLWSGTTNSSWNNSGNWVPCNSYGLQVTDNAKNYVPLADTYGVLVRSTNVPTLYNSISQDSGSSSGLSLELNSPRNSCCYIFFNANATLIGQEYLNYDSARIDLLLNTNEWLLLSSPIRGLVSGDFYIPQSYSSASLFAPLDSCDGRHTTPIWQSVYNSYVMETSTGGSVTMGSVGWTTPASGLSTQFVARSGFCIWVKGSTGDSEYMTIPKQSSKYYYYSANDVISSIYEDITRPSDYYKLAFIDSTFTGVPSVTLNSTNSQLGLAGNPFMTTLYMTQFFADNPHLTGSYWVLNDNALEACTASGESTSGTSGVVNVPMMQSFFVETEESTNFSLTDLMYRTQATYPSTSSSAAPAIEDVSRLRITANYGGYKSKTLLIERHAATAGYSSGEDVKLIVLDKQKTPSSVYTIADGMALQINAMPELLHVPLVLRRTDPGFYGNTFTLEFTGINSFSGNLELFDAQKNIRYSLVEGMILALEVTNSDQLRYYISHSSSEVDVADIESDSKIVVYTPESNKAVVVSNSIIQRIKVFDTQGRLILELLGNGTSSITLDLETGIYIMEVDVCNGREVVSVLVK